MAAWDHQRIFNWQISLLPIVWSLSRERRPQCQKLAHSPKPTYSTQWHKKSDTPVESRSKPSKYCWSSSNDLWNRAMTCWSPVLANSVWKRKRDDGEGTRLPERILCWHQGKSSNSNDGGSLERRSTTIYFLLTLLTEARTAHTIFSSKNISALSCRAFGAI